MKEKIIINSFSDECREMIYKAFLASSKEMLLSRKFEGYCTKNVANFIAIANALLYCKKNDIDLPIYSNNMVAIKWIKEKKYNSKLYKTKKNQIIYETLESALKWLNNNDFKNPILFWDKKKLGNFKSFFFMINKY